VRAGEKVERAWAREAGKVTRELLLLPALPLALSRLVVVVVAVDIVTYLFCFWFCLARFGTTFDFHFGGLFAVFFFGFFVDIADRLRLP